MEVEYIQHYGDDLIVCNAARVSFDKKSDWEIIGYDEEYDEDDRVVFSFPIRKLSAKDEKLIHFLAKNKHTSCFEHMGATLKLKVPIFIARQIQRHRTFSYNEISRRYVDSPPEFFWPDKWRKRAVNVKQGSAEDEVPCMLRVDGTPFVELTPQMYAESLVDSCVTTYNGLLDSGVAPEQARMILPQNLYTEMYMSGNLRAWAHFLALRLDGHAQAEVRVVAEQVKDILTPLFPISMEALMDNS